MTTRFCPMKVCEALGDHKAELARLLAEVSREADQAAAQWKGLRNCGGAREDHAAAFLIRIAPHLDRLALYCDDMSNAIVAMAADPFGENAESEADNA